MNRKIGQLKLRRRSHHLSFDVAVKMGKAKESRQAGRRASRQREKEEAVGRMDGAIIATNQ